jgi:hypothetical protein
MRKWLTERRLRRLRRDLAACAPQAKAVAEAITVLQPQIKIDGSDIVAMLNRHNRGQGRGPISA